MVWIQHHESLAAWSIFESIFLLCILVIEFSLYLEILNILLSFWDCGRRFPSSFVSVSNMDIIIKEASAKETTEVKVQTATHGMYFSWIFFCHWYFSWIRLMHMYKQTLIFLQLYVKIENKVGMNNEQACKTDGRVFIEN